MEIYIPPKPAIILPAPKKLLHGLGGGGAVMFGMGVAAPLTYTTWNPSDKLDMTLSGGDLTATATANTSPWVRSVSGKSSGKYYVETNFDNFSDQDDPKFGISKAGATIGGSFLAFGGDANSFCIAKYGAGSSTPQKRTGNVSTNLGSSATYVAGKKLMMAVDITNGMIWWGYDGTWFDGGNPGAGTGAQFTSGIAGNTWYVGWYETRNTYATTTNFGSTTFAHSLPSGFTGWTT